jgi:hypothetical protein
MQLASGPPFACEFQSLSWNNPAGLHFAELAERVERQAKELELQNTRVEDDGTATAGARG